MSHRHHATRTPIRIADEATRRAWGLLWPDMPDAPRNPCALSLETPGPDDDDGDEEETA